MVPGEGKPLFPVKSRNVGSGVTAEEPFGEPQRERACRITYLTVLEYVFVTGLLPFYTLLPRNNLLDVVEFVEGFEWR